MMVLLSIPTGACAAELEGESMTKLISTYPRDGLSTSLRNTGVTKIEAFAGVGAAVEVAVLVLLGLELEPELEDIL